MTGPLFDIPTAGDILGAMITPAVLFSAYGTLTHRGPRPRPTTAGRNTPPSDATDLDTLDKRALIADQARQTQRIGILQAAVITLYVGISLLVGSSLEVGLSAVAQGRLEWVPVGFGMLGATALFVGAILLIQEARLAVRSTLSELDYVKHTVARRTGAPLPAPGPNG